MRNNHAIYELDNLGIIFCIYISEYFKIFEIKKSRSLGKHSFLTCGVILGCLSSTFSFGFLYGVAGAAVPSMFRFTANKKRDENADN